MSSGRLTTVLVGFGRIGRGFAEDDKMSRYFQYATHAQVLRDHPSFFWHSVVDASHERQSAAQSQWQVRHVAGAVEALPEKEQIDIAVLATPPECRLHVLEALPNLKAVLVEKPLGCNLAEAGRFLVACRQREILVQVNLLRRADEFTQDLAAGGLSKSIGSVQAAFGIYCNGLLNNGTHMVDLVRMLLGEVESVQALAAGSAYREGPLETDVNVPFVLNLANSLSVSIQPVRLVRYRENGLDLWGDKGRLSYLHGGLTLLAYARGDNRAVSGEHEIAVDSPEVLRPTLGQAIYRMYTNLAAAVVDNAPLVSSGESALRTAAVIEAIRTSVSRGGAQVSVDEMVGELPAVSELELAHGYRG